MRIRSMHRRALRAGAGICAALVLTGCGGGILGGTQFSTLHPLPACRGLTITVHQIEKDPATGQLAGKDVAVPITDERGVPTQIFFNEAVEGLTRDPSAPTKEKATNAFDQLLNCYIGPIDESRTEQRLYRGHVIVTMLAMYGSYNLRVRSYPGIEDHAATILKSIAEAELSLSRSSGVLYTAANGKGPRPQTPLNAFIRVDRVVDVLQVSIDVERPTYGRVREGVFNLIAAIGGSPSAVDGLVKEAVTALRKAVVIAVYGSALRTDAYTDLARLKTGTDPTAEDWAGWDVPLTKACREIAAIAKVQNVACVPSAATLLDSFSTGTPSRKPGT